MSEHHATPAIDEEATARVQATAPFVASLGIQAIVVHKDHVLLRLPDAESGRNHMGGPHAGAIFSLGETAAATLMTENFGGWYDRVAPLAVQASIAWSKLARSAVTAEARMLRPAAEVEADLAAGVRPEWDNEVVFRREQDGEVCGRMNVTLTLVARRD